MADKAVFLYAAIYDDIPDAEGDYEAVADLHAAGLIGTFDAAVIEKREGEVHVHKTEKRPNTAPGRASPSARSRGSSSHPRSSAARSSAALQAG